MQEKSTVISKKIEPINFVWVGPPKYNQGGHDVVGISSIASNFSKFGQKNPLIFWCENKYKQEYEKYFSDNGIPVTVNAIEEHLEAKSSDTNQVGYVRTKATQVDNIYRTLFDDKRVKILEEKQNTDIQIKDRVRFKNVFFLFIVATEGGYVLDTNIRAPEDVQVDFTSFDTFHFPLTQEESKPDQVEIWMLYSPEPNFERARNSLNNALCKYSAYLPLLCWQGLSSNDIDRMGNVSAVNSITLSPSNDLHDIQANIWKAKRLSNSNDFYVEEINVIKEYYNTHYGNTDDNYSIIQLHAAFGQIDRIRDDIKYGLKPGEFVRNPCRESSKLSFDAVNETLLHIVMRYLKNENSRFLECARIYLENGADPNAIYQYTPYHRGEKLSTRERSPLFDAISNKSLEGLDLLFYFKVDVSQYVNQKTALMFAVEENFKEGVLALLKYGANPNQPSEDQLSSPLKIALTKGHSEIVEILLQSEADNKFRELELEANEEGRDCLLSNIGEKEVTTSNPVSTNDHLFFQPPRLTQSLKGDTENEATNLINPSSVTKAL